MQVSKSLSCPFCCIRVLRGSRQLARCCLTNRFTIFIGRTGRHEPDKLTLLFLELLPACNSLRRSRCSGGRGGWGYQLAASSYQVHVSLLTCMHTRTQSAPETTLHKVQYTAGAPTHYSVSKKEEYAYHTGQRVRQKRKGDKRFTICRV